ncbi:MAG: hypothetical protein ABI564_18905 [Ideonella sp.]
MISGTTAVVGVGVTGSGKLAEGAAVGGAVLQPTSAPRIVADNNSARLDDRASFETMWILVLEALAAGFLLVLIVWWTMFSGRRKGERDEGEDEPS